MEKEKKYRLLEQGFCNLHRIVALRDFSDVKKGDMGGCVESERNLAQDGDAWVYDNAWVCGDAKVYGNACVYDNAKVYGNARVCGNAWVCGNASVYGDVKVYDNANVYGDAKVYGSARVYGDARVCGDAKVSQCADYIVFKNWWSSGRYFTWTRSNDMWKVGCFYGTGDELIKKAYKDSLNSGDEYTRIVAYVKRICETYK